MSADKDKRLSKCWQLLRPASWRETMGTCGIAGEFPLRFRIETDEDLDFDQPDGVAAFAEDVPG